MAHIGSVGNERGREAGRGRVAANLGPASRPVTLEAGCARRMSTTEAT